MNEFTLLGRLTKDVDLRKSQNGNSFAYINIATPRDKEHTDFIDVMLFGATADFAGKYFCKGKYIAVKGHIDTSSFEKEGRRVYVQKLVGDRVYFAGYNNTPASHESGDNSDFLPGVEEGDLPF